MSYAVEKKLVLGFLAFYFVAGVYAVDQYPFFNWALFTKIPNEQTDFTIEVRSFDGTKYDPPLAFSETRFIFDAIGQSPTQYTQPISELGQALDRDDGTRIAERRAYIERVFDGKEFSYDVLKITYDPVELWRTGAYRSREVIASYDSSHAP